MIDDEIASSLWHSQSFWSFYGYNNKEIWESFIGNIAELCLEIRLRLVLLMKRICTRWAIKYQEFILVIPNKWSVFNLHINFVIKKLQAILYDFKFLKNDLLVEQIRTFYYCLLESYTRYGIVTRGSALRCHKNNLEITQKRFLKLIIT